MIYLGTWKGPTILTGQAFVHYNGNDPSKLWLPEGGKFWRVLIRCESFIPSQFTISSFHTYVVAITLIHGTKDELVEIEGSRLLATKGTPQLVELIEIADEHQLQSLVDNHMFLNLVREVYEKQKRYQE